MKGKRASIAGLMGTIVMVGVAFAALRSASVFSVNLGFFLTGAVFMAATFMATRSRGNAAAWWVGFATFGWTYLMLGLVLWPWKTLLEIDFFFLSDALGNALNDYMGEAEYHRNMSRSLILHDILSILVALVGAAVVRFIAARTKAVERREGPPA
jgi:hypothetical protein